MVKKLLNFLRFDTFDILFFVTLFITHSNKLVSQMLIYDESSSLLFAEIGLCFCMASFVSFVINFLKFLFEKILNILSSVEDKTKKPL